MTLLNSVTIIADVLSTMQKDRLMLAMIDGGLPNEALQEKAKFLVPPPFVTPPHLIFPLTNLSNHRITLVVKKTKKKPIKIMESNHQIIESNPSSDGCNVILVSQNSLFEK